MKKLFSRGLCLLVSLALLFAPAVTFAEENQNNIEPEETTEVTIEDEETPLYAGVNGDETYAAYVGLIGIGAIFIFGGVYFIQKKRA